MDVRHGLVGHWLLLSVTLIISWLILSSKSVATSSWSIELTLRVQTHDRAGGKEAGHTASIIPFLQDVRDR